MTYYHVNEFKGGKPVVLLITTDENAAKILLDRLEIADLDGFITKFWMQLGQQRAEVVSETTKCQLRIARLRRKIV